MQSLLLKWWNANSFVLLLQVWIQWRMLREGWVIHSLVSREFKKKFMKAVALKFSTTISREWKSKEPALESGTYRISFIWQSARLWGFIKKCKKLKQLILYMWGMIYYDMELVEPRVHVPRLNTHGLCCISIRLISTLPCIKDLKTQPRNMKWKCVLKIVRLASASIYTLFWSHLYKEKN